jgi:hypothetical protein
MRPIDFCHPYEMRAPVPRAFPAFATAAFAAWGPRGVWAPRSLTGGPSDSRRSRPLRRIIDDIARLGFVLRTRPERPRRSHERGRFVPTVSRHDRASDIPVASLSCTRLEPAFAVPLGV